MHPCRKTISAVLDKNLIFFLPQLRSGRASCGDGQGLAELAQGPTRPPFLSKMIYSKKRLLKRSKKYRLNLNTNLNVPMPNATAIR
jgi:hypothetical protein